MSTRIASDDTARAPSTSTLIVGGAGKTGRRVADRLRALGVDARLASRSASPRFDWADRSSWAPALEGVDRIYLTYYPDLAAPGAADDIRALTALAVAHGVTHVVLLSGRGEPQVLPSEQAVQACGATWTILRAAWFAQNFSEGHLREPVLAGELAFPGGSVAEPFVDVDDVADVAVAALTDPKHAGQIYDLTGPRLLTFAEAMTSIGAASSRPIRYRPIRMEEYAEELAPHVPASYLAFMTELFAGLLDGHNAHLGDGVQRVLGRPARDFADYARDAARAGAFQPRTA